MPKERELDGESVIYISDETLYILYDVYVFLAAPKERSILSIIFVLLMTWFWFLRLFKISF